MKKEGMVTLPTPALVTRRWTRDEYHKMSELGILAPDERVELIEGGIVPMSPQKSRHAATIRAFEEALRKIFVTGWDVRVQMPLALGLTSEPEPDVAVVTGSFRDYVNTHPTMAQLVVEVSDTTLDLDRGLKAGLYAKAGIPEYWVVNLPEQLLEVHREPVPMPAQPLGFGYRVLLRLNPSGNIAPHAAPGSPISVADLWP